MSDVVERAELVAKIRAAIRAELRENFSGYIAADELTDDQDYAVTIDGMLDVKQLAEAIAAGCTPCQKLGVER